MTPKKWCKIPSPSALCHVSCMMCRVLLSDTNITCLIPDDCILPCSFRPTGTVVIHWYKQQIPVHSYYYNKDQFGLQNKHFSGRTALFNSQIPHGNASLLLKRVKVQDKGRYKCYTSTRKGNQELFVNLDVKCEYNRTQFSFFNIIISSCLISSPGKTNRISKDACIKRGFSLTSEAMN